MAISTLSWRQNPDKNSTRFSVTDIGLLYIFNSLSFTSMTQTNIQRREAFINHCVDMQCQKNLNIAKQKVTMYSL